MLRYDDARNFSEYITAVDNVHTFKRLLKTHFLTNVTVFMSFHSAAILTVSRYIVLPIRSCSCTLGIKDTFIRLD